MKRSELKQKIDELGALRAQQTSLDAAERALSKTVREEMERAELHAVEAAEYSAQLAEKRTLKIDPKEFRKRIGEEIFLACARVDVKEARTRCTDEQLERCGEFDTRLELRVSRLPGRE